MFWESASKAGTKAGTFLNPIGKVSPQFINKTAFLIQIGHFVLNFRVKRLDNYHKFATGSCLSKTFQDISCFISLYFFEFLG